jgi:UrcA family protein
MPYLASIRMNPLGRGLPVAFAVGALALLGARAHAADSDQLSPVQLDPITVSAPGAKIVDRDAATGAAIEMSTVSARVQVDPVALRTEYGALMLNYSVRDAARKACSEADPFSDDDGTCVQKAVADAKPQIEAAIAQARSNLTG